MRRADSLEKDPDAGKDWGRDEKGTTEDEMVGWHHWLDGHEFKQTPGDSEGQRNLMCCSPWSWIWLSDWTTTTSNLRCRSVSECSPCPDSSTPQNSHCTLPLGGEPLLPFCWLWMGLRFLPVWQEVVPPGGCFFFLLLWALDYSWLPAQQKPFSSRYWKIAFPLFSRHCFSKLFNQPVNGPVLKPPRRLPPPLNVLQFFNILKCDTHN